MRTDLNFCPNIHIVEAELMARVPFTVTYLSVYYRSLKGMLKFFGFFSARVQNLARPESLSYSNNNNRAVFSLAPPSLFSLLCSFNFLPGCLHHRSAVIGVSRGLGGTRTDTVPQLCSQHPPTDVTIWATVGELERRGPFLPLPLFALRDDSV